MLFSRDQFAAALALKESGNSYDPQPPNPIAFGKYQFTRGRLNELEQKYDLPGWNDPDYFVANHDLQEEYFTYHVQDLLNQISNEHLEDFVGIEKTSENGHKGSINIYGLVAGSHFAGVEGLKDYLTTGHDRTDKNEFTSNYVVDFSNRLRDLDIINNLPGSISQAAAAVGSNKIILFGLLTAAAALALIKYYETN
jgi:hypothetical protein